MKHITILFIIMLAGCQLSSLKPSVTDDNVSKEHGHEH